MTQAYSPIIKVANKMVGVGQPVFIIAEAGVNHNGNINLAKQLIDVAVEAQADAVKFQSFTAEELVTAQAPKAEYQVENTGGTETQLEMLRRLELTNEATRELSSYCKDRGIIFLSTPFSEDAADFLYDLDVPAFKVSSGDLNNLPLLRHLANKHKPIILSTGMSTLAEVSEALETTRTAGADEIVILHCVSDYPAQPRDVNLRAMQTMSNAFGAPVGYSDHTLGIEVALAAVALGASVIEKHFTLDKHLPGPDHRASLDPTELRALVQGIRKVEVSLGNGEKRPTERELKTALIARRSLVAAQHISAGSCLTREMLTLKRPGSGLSPATLSAVIGRTARIDIDAGSLLDWGMLI